MQVAQPAFAPSGSPLCGENDQIQGMDLLDLQPVRAAIARRVSRGAGLCHQALVTLRDGLIQKGLGAAGIVGQQTRDDDIAPCESVEMVETRHGWLIE